MNTGTAEAALPAWAGTTATIVVLLVAVALIAGMIFIIRQMTDYSDNVDEPDKYKALRDFVSALFGKKAAQQAEADSAEAQSAAAADPDKRDSFCEPCPACGVTVTEQHIFCPSCGLRLQ